MLQSVLGDSVALLKLSRKNSRAKKTEETRSVDSHSKRLKQAEEEKRDRKAEDKKAKKTEETRSVDSNNDYVGVRPMHRSMFNRRVSLPNYALSGGLVQRDYFDDKKEFKKLLKAFTAHHNITLERIGYASTRLHFCVRCYDVNKSSSNDIYYVDRTSKSKTPKSFCLGCLGALLKEHETKEDDNVALSDEIVTVEVHQ